MSILLLFDRRTLAALWREPVLKRPVLIIESDDWGAGPPRQAKQLERLAAVLESHADRLGQKPVMTLGIVLSVADGARILADELRRYYRKRLDEPDFVQILAAIKRGAKTGVFALQLHGEEHYWPPALLAAARTRPQIASWLSSSAAETETLPAALQSRWIDAAELPSKPLHHDELRTAALAEVASFRKVFGHAPSVAVPPTFIWNDAVEAGWAEAGVRCVVTPGRRYEARDAQGEPIAAGPAIRNGERSAAGMSCVVRDDYFEPAHGHKAERGLAALDRKTRTGRPTLLETHRANFLGDAALAASSIAELDRLLGMALQRFPQLMFLSTEALAMRMRRNDPELVERRLHARLRVWLLRLWEIAGLRKSSGGYLMLTELFLPTKGGTAVSFDDDFRRLGGKEIHIVTADVPGAAEFDRAHPNTIHRLRLKRVAWLRPESLAIYCKLIFKSVALLARNRFSAVFAGRALPEGLVAWLIGRLTGRPVLIYAHGEELTGWGRGRKFAVMRFVLKRADALLSNSDFTRDTLVNLIGVDPGRIELTYPTVDENRFRPGLPCQDLRSRIGLRPGERLILSVGRLMRRKGFDNVIRALPLLQRQGIDARYAVIGIGEDYEYLTNLAQELAVADRVDVLGNVSYEELPRWYSACDLFALPNRDIGGDTEGFGLALLEAAAAGKPALTGTAGGTGSAVVDSVTGLRVDGESVDAIAQALARLLSNPLEAAQMGRNGRERVLKNYTHQRRVDQLRRLASQGRRRVVSSPIDTAHEKSP